MPDIKDEGGEGQDIERPAPAHTPPFRGPAGPFAARGPFRGAAPVSGRVTVPPFMPPIQHGGPRPGTARQPGLVGTPLAALAAPAAPAAPAAAPSVSPFAQARRPVATPVMQPVVDEASVTAEHTNRLVPYPGEQYFAPVNAPLSSRAGLDGFSDDPASLTVELRRVPQILAAPLPPAPEPVAPLAAGSRTPFDDEALPSIEAYVMRSEPRTAEPPPAYFSIDPPVPIAAAVPLPPMPVADPTAPDAGTRTPDEIERERQALVEAIVGAVVHAIDDRDSARDRRIDLDATTLFAADPFVPPADDAGDETNRAAIPAAPSPFDDEPDITHNMMSDYINDYTESAYAAQQPGPAEPWPTPSLSRPWRRTPGPTPLVTPAFGMRAGPPPASEFPPIPPFNNPRSPTPTHESPILPPRVATPLSSPVVPPRPAARRTPVRSPTPVFVAIPTPLSVPAVPDLASARAMANALETVAAKIRAGHLVVSGEVTEGVDEDATYAGYLAAALAALLGVRH
jgi:hypothetical protein